ncbi:hypothetical protein E0493_02225 [Roseomonas sp. M0104]|uniref:Uncharacterized protein n=1 Tax=Teichococcus coralli TaxID=2545983 RepID=A0A845B6T6_9PROT|nr:hypothetical protein [Pseudoroseomonas coralli]MXP62168.1 hypothetical protein [Pseudoroseomonas coralli]
MALDNSDITPPRPPEGTPSGQAPAKEAAKRREQLNPEAPPSQQAPAAPGALPAGPNPEPPENPPSGDPKPKPVPPDAEKEFPQRHYGNSEPEEPPPSTRA